MSGEIVREWYFWLVSIATGACMAFAYDVLRLFRRLFRHGRIAVDLEDILYWTACFVVSFTLLYYGNNGVIRFAAVLGAAVGMFLYIVTVGRFFVRISLIVIDKTLGNLFRMMRKIIRKLRRLLSPIKRFVVKICHKFKHLFNILFQKIRLTHARNRHKMKLQSRKEAADGKGKAADGRKKGKRKRKKSKKKDTEISPRQE